MRRRRNRDEELASVGIGPVIRHRQNSRPLEIQAGIDLVGKLVAWIAFVVAQRVSALNHELGYHALKGRSRIQGLVFHLPGDRVFPWLRSGSKPTEIRDRLGSFLFKQPEN